MIGYTEGENSFDDNSLPLNYISQICDLKIQKVTFNTFLTTSKPISFYFFIDIFRVM